METQTETQTEKKFLTPSYQRKAYKDYYKRKREEPEFREKLRQQQREYYQRNKDMILARKQAKRDKIKAEKQEQKNTQN